MFDGDLRELDLADGRLVLSARNNERAWIEGDPVTVTDYC